MRSGEKERERSVLFRERLKFLPRSSGQTKWFRGSKNVAECIFVKCACVQRLWRQLGGRVRIYCFVEKKNQIQVFSVLVNEKRFV